MRDGLAEAPHETFRVEGSTRCPERSPRAWHTIRALGLSRGPSPKFAKRFAELGDAAVAAFKTYVNEVRAGEFPDADHSYKPNNPESEPKVAAASGDGGVVVPFLR